MAKALSQRRSPGLPETRFRLFLTPQAAAVAIAGAACWLAVLWWARSIGAMGMTVSAIGFVWVWVLMMGAMMLPSVAPVAALYARALAAGRWSRLARFALGYMAIWSLTSVPALTLGALAAAAWPMSSAGRAVATAILLAAFAAYQLSPLKAWCLRHCRSPLSSLLRYGSYSGPLKDLRAGLHHAAYCVGCCWALMVLLLAVGAMNLLSMLAVTALVLVEKYAPHGVFAARATAALALVAALVALRFPQLGLSFGSM